TGNFYGRRVGQLDDFRRYVGWGRRFRRRSGRGAWNAGDGFRPGGVGRRGDGARGIVCGGIGGGDDSVGRRTRRRRIELLVQLLGDGVDGVPICRTRSQSEIFLIFLQRQLRIVQIRFRHSEVQQRRRVIRLLLQGRVEISEGVPVAFALHLDEAEVVQGLDVL